MNSVNRLSSLIKHWVFTLMGVSALAWCALISTSDARPRGLGSLKGSSASLDRQQNARRRAHLKLHLNKKSVRRSIQRGELKRVRPTRHLELAHVSYPYAHPKLHQLLTKLSALYWRHCRAPLVVTSLLRPRNEQPRNASPRSVHPAGIAVDLRVPPRVCRRWLRDTLSSWERDHLVEATREYRPPHFHVVIIPHRLNQGVINRLRGGKQSAARRVQSASKSRNDRRRVKRRSKRSTEGKPKKYRRTRYKVKRGDSLWGLSRRWGVSQKSIMSANHLSSKQLDRGQLLVIPKK